MPILSPNIVQTQISHINLKKTNFGHICDEIFYNANFRKSEKMTKNPKKNIGIIDFFKKDFSSGVPDFLTDNTVQYLSYKFEKTHFGHFCDEIS